MGDATFMKLKDRLDSLNDAQRSDMNTKIQSSGLRSLVAIGLWNFFFGTLGVARFMIGDTMLGAIRLTYQIIVIVLQILVVNAGVESTIAYVSGFCTIGLWIWWIVDIFLVDKKVRMQNLRKVLLVIDGVKSR